MSNPILQSNQSSAVVATVNESDVTVPFVYNEKSRLIKPHSLQVLPITSTSGSTAPQSACSYDVAKNGIAVGFYLEVNLIGLPTNNYKFNALGILNLIDEVSLTTSGRVVEKLDAYQIVSRYASLPLARQGALSVTCGNDETITTASTKTYIWLPFYMFRDSARYGILTNFEEPHHVEVKWSKYTQTLVRGTANTSLPQSTIHNNISVTSANLLVHYKQLADDDVNEMIRKNYSNGMLSRLVGISKREQSHYVQGIVSNDTYTESVELHETEAIRGMTVLVTHLGELANITNIKLTFNNTDVLDVGEDFLHTFASNWDMHSASFGSHARDEQIHDYKRAVRLDLGIGNDTALDNVIALREMNNPRVEVQFDPIRAGEHQIHIIYETATFLTCSADTGRVQLSISS